MKNGVSVCCAVAHHNVTVPRAPLLRESVNIRRRHAFLEHQHRPYTLQKTILISDFGTRRSFCPPPNVTSEEGGWEMTYWDGQRGGLGPDREEMHLMVCAVTTLKTLCKVLHMCSVQLMPLARNR
jgi:hypothetical protein